MIKRRGRRPKIIQNQDGDHVLVENKDAVQDTHSVSLALDSEGSSASDPFQVDENTLRNNDLDFSCVKDKNVGGIDFSGTDFSGYDIRGFVFDRCNFTGCDFTGSCLQGVVFKDCEIVDIVTTDADLRWSSLDASCHQ